MDYRVRAIYLGMLGVNRFSAKQYYRGIYITTSPESRSEIALDDLLRGQERYRDIYDVYET